LLNSAKKMMSAGACGSARSSRSGGAPAGALLNSAKKMMSAGGSSSALLNSARKMMSAGAGCSSCGKQSGGGGGGAGCSSCSGKVGGAKKKESMLSSIFDLSGGNEIKSLHELMMTTPQETNYSLRHQKGGKDPLALDYSGIKSSGLAPGPGFNASAAQYSNKFLASDPINIMPTINKTVSADFGSTSQSTQPFTYATNDFQKAGATKKNKKKNKKSVKKNTAQTNKKNKQQQNKF
jgi:hypothetical protein